jgi:hypothetical protein
MKKVFVKSSNIHRNCYDIEITQACTRANESLRDYGDEARLSDHMQSLQIVRNAQRHVSLITLVPKPPVHRIFVELPSNHRNMLGSEKLPLAKHPTCDRMTASHRTGVAVSKQALLIKALETIGGARDGYIHGTADFEGIKYISRARLNPNSDAVGLVLQSFQ